MKLISSEQKIVIFGAKGMVGSAILRCLQKNGYSKKKWAQYDLV